MRVGRLARARTAPRPNDLVPLAERMGSLALLRAGLAALAVAAALAGPALVSPRDVIEPSIALVAGSTLLEVARRLIGGRRLALVAAALLLDAFYLSWIVYVTGGAASPLRFLLYAHLVAVTLAASHRTGLKLAAWYSLLFLATSYAEAAGAIPVREAVGSWLPGRGDAFATVAATHLAGIWLVALATAALSAVNEGELRRRNLDLEHLADMVRELDRVDTVEATGAALASSVARFLSLPRVLVVRRSGDETEVIGSIPPMPRRGGPSGADPDQVLSRAWRTRRTQLVRALDSGKDPMLSAVLPGARNVVVVPMSAEGDVVGALVVEHGPGRDVIRRWTVAVLEQFASHAALVMNNVVLLDEVRRMAATDALTGIANRRSFEETLDREIARAERTGEPVSLVLLDVDHFKRLNDEHGHPFGDEVLRAVGTGIGEHLRPFDTAARYGGEEFAVILPKCTVIECETVAERIRRIAASSTRAGSVTLSAGAATFPAHAADADELVRAADEALYRSKRAGRNRLTSARPAAPSRS
jgi:two-component system cell cycle response regulator